MADNSHHQQARAWACERCNTTNDPSAARCRGCSHGRCWYCRADVADVDQTVTQFRGLRIASPDPSWSAAGDVRAWRCCMCKRRVALSSPACYACMHTQCPKCAIESVETEDS